MHTAGPEETFANAAPQGQRVTPDRDQTETFSPPTGVIHNRGEFREVFHNGHIRQQIGPRTPDEVDSNPSTAKENPMDILTTLVGNVGAEPEFRLSSAGVPVITFSVASTPRTYRDGVWKDGDTSWVRVTCFRGLADNVRESVHRGDAVVVYGRLRTSWTDSQGVVHDRVSLEAITVGHDITRGVARFERNRREPATGPAEAAPVEEPPTAYAFEPTPRSAPTPEEMPMAA
jgi:single-strand DNA-binding protein